MESWEGNGDYYDGQTARARKVRVTAARTFLRIDFGDHTEQFHTGEYRLERSESADYFRISLKPFDGPILAVQGRAFRDFVRTQKTSSPADLSLVPMPVKLGLFISLALLLGYGLYVYIMPVFLDWGAERIPAKIEKTIGDQAVKTIVRDTAPAPDSLRAVLEKCEGLLRGMRHDKPYDFKIFLVEDSNVINAFALPGGNLLIYRGLLNFMEDEDEFLGVLFHEAGHIYHRHSLKQLMRTAVLGFFMSLFFGDVSGLAAVLVDNSEMLLKMDYSRKAEREADEFAVAAMDKYGVDKSGLLSFFEKLQEKTALPGFLNVISTHPATEERIAFIRKSIEAYNGDQPLLTDEEWRMLKQPQPMGSKQSFQKNE